MTIDDKNIIEIIRTKPEQGFKLLLEKYSEPIYWHIRRLVVSHDDAQDAVQETFIRIYRSFSQFREESSFRGWIFKIATNEALRVIRKQKQDCDSIDEDTFTEILTASSYVDYTDLETIRLQKAIHTLPAKQQLVFCLRYYDELSYAEIAEIAGSTESTAKVNFHIAKEKVINFLKKND